MSVFSLRKWWLYLLAQDFCTATQIRSLLGPSGGNVVVEQSGDNPQLFRTTRTKTIFLRMVFDHMVLQSLIPSDGPEWAKWAFFLGG